MNPDLAIRTDSITVDKPVAYRRALSTCLIFGECDEAFKFHQIAFERLQRAANVISDLYDLSVAEGFQPLDVCSESLRFTLFFPCFLS